MNNKYLSRAEALFGMMLALILWIALLCGTEYGIESLPAVLYAICIALIAVLAILVALLMAWEPKKAHELEVERWMCIALILSFTLAIALGKFVSGTEVVLLILVGTEVVLLILVISMMRDGEAQRV